MGCKIKLLAVAERQGDGLALRVAPTLVPIAFPLASVSSNYNAVRIDASAAGPTLLVGQGAGALPTASAVLADLIDIAAGRYAHTVEHFRFMQPINLHVFCPKSRFGPVHLPELPCGMSQAC